MSITYTVTVDELGSQVWRHNGELHRLDGPAIDLKDSHKYWYKNGLLHREDGPACEYDDGSKAWYINGKLHREDGPAGEYFNKPNENAWYLEGIRMTEENFNNKIMIKRLIEGKAIEIKGTRYRLTCAS